ncbi:MAG: iron-containing alcohol dehydrogenase [Oscillospiraceae bacterium]|nr:iron-containing alcohol dehydrogenase [Oscillospiraceae bacterium]
MLDFTYYAPTKVHFGKGKHKDVGKIIKEYGYKRIMLQYGKGSIKKSGLYEEVIKALAENDIEVVEMGGVEPNPKISFVREAVKLARERNVEMILAVGGGSVIDSCKYTAAGAVNDCDVWEFPTRKTIPSKSLPVGCILTIAAAGSEMSCSAVITNTELNMKRGFNNEVNRCKFAICNPELTYTVSEYHTACGIVDIMAHTMERYFTVCEPTDLTDRIAESILKSVVGAGRVLMENPCDYDARATVMWASSLSHNDLTGCGRENVLAVHQLEHALSGEYDYIAHGAGLAVLFPAWARYVCKYNISRFAQFARRVWDVSDTDDAAAAYGGIEKMAQFFADIKMPLRLRDFDIPSDCSARLADLCTFGKQREIKSFISLDYDRVREIFESCW